MGATAAPRQDIHPQGDDDRRLTGRMRERQAELERAEALKTPEQRREESIRARRAIHALHAADVAWIEKCERAARSVIEAPVKRRIAPRRRGAGRPAAARSSARSGGSGDDEPGEPAEVPTRESDADARVAGDWAWWPHPSQPCDECGSRCWGIRPGAECGTHCVGIRPGDTVGRPGETLCKQCWWRANRAHIAGRSAVDYVERAERLATDHPDASGRTS